MRGVLPEKIISAYVSQILMLRKSAPISAKYMNLIKISDSHWSRYHGVRRQFRAPVRWEIESLDLSRGEPIKILAVWWYFSCFQVYQTSIKSSDFTNFHQKYHPIDPPPQSSKTKPGHPECKGTHSETEPRGNLCKFYVSSSDCFSSRQTYRNSRKYTKFRKSLIFIDPPTWGCSGHTN